MYSVSGFAVGLLVGITGVGGGSLMTPLLVFLFGFKASVAVGTDLLYAAITKTGGVFVHHGKHRSVDWPIVAWLSLGSLPLAGLTLLAIKHYMEIGKETTGLITYSLGIALILTACALLIRAVIMRKSKALGQLDDNYSNMMNAGRFPPALADTYHDPDRGRLGRSGDFILRRRRRIGHGRLAVPVPARKHLENCRYRPRPCHPTYHRGGLGAS